MDPLIIQEGYGGPGCVAAGPILLPDPELTSDNSPTPGQYVSALKLDVNIGINLEAVLEEV